MIKWWRQWREFVTHREAEHEERLVKRVRQWVDNEAGHDQDYIAEQIIAHVRYADSTKPW